MKKLLFIGIFGALCFFACKKQSSQESPKQNSYLIGNWVNTLSQDTTFARQSNTFVVTNYSAGSGLTFLDTSSVKYSNDLSLTYFIKDGIIDFGNGRLFKIIKISDSSIKTYWSYYASGVDVSRVSWVELYTKE